MLSFAGGSAPTLCGLALSSMLVVCLFACLLACLSLVVCLSVFRLPVIGYWLLLLLLLMLLLVLLLLVLGCWFLVVGC